MPRPDLTMLDNLLKQLQILGERVAIQHIVVREFPGHNERILSVWITHKLEPVTQWMSMFGKPWGGLFGRLRRRMPHLRPDDSPVTRRASSSKRMGLAWDREWGDALNIDTRRRVGTLKNGNLIIAQKNPTKGCLLPIVVVETYCR